MKVSLNVMFHKNTTGEKGRHFIDIYIYKYISLYMNIFIYKYIYLYIRIYFFIYKYNYLYKYVNIFIFI